MTCPNDTNHDGDCHLCHRLTTGCFMRDTAPHDGPPEVDEVAHRLHCRITVGSAIPKTEALLYSPSPSLLVPIKP